MKIQERLHNYCDKDFVFLWVPSHKGIEGNEIADILANEALLIEEEAIIERPITIKDLRSRIKKHFREEILLSWQRINPDTNKLRRIKSDVGPTRTLKLLKRVEATKITRLRLGHSRLTHGHFMAIKDSRKCKCEEIITVEHIYNSCPMMRKARNKFKIKNIHALNNDNIENYKNIIGFLKKTNLYN